MFSEEQATVSSLSSSSLLESVLSTAQSFATTQEPSEAERLLGGMGNLHSEVPEEPRSPCLAPESTILLGFAADAGGSTSSIQGGPRRQWKASRKATGSQRATISSTCNPGWPLHAFAQSRPRLEAKIQEVEEETPDLKPGSRPVLAARPGRARMQPKPRSRQCPRSRCQRTRQSDKAGEHSEAERARERKGGSAEQDCVRTEAQQSSIGTKAP